MADSNKGKKPKKPGRWTITDLLFGFFGLAAIVAVTYAAFLAVKWASAKYF
ncbi:MAG: hypothetical protein V3V37_05430 [Candidatus Adiutricales bacterium]